MKYLTLTAIFLLLISCQQIPQIAAKKTVETPKQLAFTKAQSRALEEVKCEERDSVVTDSEDPIIIKQCSLLGYRSISVREADYKGRYSYEYELQRKTEGGFNRIENTSMFLKRAELLKLLTTRLKAEYSAIENNPAVADCVEGEPFHGVNSLNDFGIEFSDGKVYFHYSFGLSGACFNVDAAIIFFELNDIRKYIRE